MVGRQQLPNSKLFAPCCGPRHTSFPAPDAAAAAKGLHVAAAVAHPGPLFWHLPHCLLTAATAVNNSETCCCVLFYCMKHCLDWCSRLRQRSLRAFLQDIQWVKIHQVPIMPCVGCLVCTNRWDISGPLICDAACWPTAILQYMHPQLLHRLLASQSATRANIWYNKEHCFTCVCAGSAVNMRALLGLLGAVNLTWPLSGVITHLQDTQETRPPVALICCTGLLSD